MAYGIEVQRPSTGKKVLTSEESITGTTTYQKGTGSSVQFFSSDILLFKPESVTSGSSKWITAEMTSSGQYTQCDFYLCSEGISDAANSTTCDYIVLRAANNVNNLPYSEYGIRTFGEDGTTVTFDTSIHRITSNVHVDDVGSSPYSHNTLLHSYDAERYVNAGLLYYDTMTNLIIRRGVRFANGHSTYGTSTYVWNIHYSPFGTTYPDSFGIYFSGKERNYGDF